MTTYKSIVRVLYVNLPRSDNEPVAYAELFNGGRLCSDDVFALIDEVCAGLIPVVTRVEPVFSRDSTRLKICMNSIGNDSGRAVYWTTSLRRLVISTLMPIYTRKVNATINVIPKGEHDDVKMTLALTSGEGFTDLDLQNCSGIGGIKWMVDRSTDQLTFVVEMQAGSSQDAITAIVKTLAGAIGAMLNDPICRLA